MTEYSGARLLVDTLIARGVTKVFGIPGAKVDAIFNELHNASDQIDLVLCRHEQNAGFMAANHGRLTGEPGVILVTSGPGVTNLTTALLTATSEGDPVVAIGANVPRSMRLKQTHQQLENASLMNHVTKSSVEVFVPESIPEALETAFRTATSAPGGATFISTPQDVLESPTDLTVKSPRPPIEKGAAPQHVIEKAARHIEQAKAPVLLLGMYASEPNNTKAIRALLHHHKLPVVGTYQAAGVVPRDLVDCFLGRVGIFKNQPGDVALDQADLVITIGYNPIEYDPETWNPQNSDKTIIAINSEPSEIHTTFLPALELVGHIAHTVEQLTQHLPTDNRVLHTQADVNQLHDSLVNTINSGGDYTDYPVHPLRFIYDLNQCADDQTTVISDLGSHYMWLARYFFCYEPRHLLFSNGQQPLGVALPWAIASRMLRPHNKIISISGDGGFLYSSMEIETAVRLQLPFVHCIWRDGAYNMVLEQEMKKYKQASGVYFGDIDVVKYAQSFGAKGYVVNRTQDLLPTLREALQETQVPVIIDVPIDYSDNPDLFASLHDHIGH